jgi:hypothetical protein
VIAGHALIQNLRRGHYELAVAPARHCGSLRRFIELAQAI